MIVPARYFAYLAGHIAISHWFSIPPPVHGPPPWTCDISCSRTLYSECVLRELRGGCSQGSPKLLFWEAKQGQGCGPCIYAAAAAAKLLQLCPTLCDPIDGSPPGSPVPGILQARILEWVAMSFSNAWKWKVKVKSLSWVQLLATPWTAAYQAPPSMGFSRQEYWSGVPLPSPPCVCVCVCVCVYPNVLFLWRILIESLHISLWKLRRVHFLGSLAQC